MGDITFNICNSVVIRDDDCDMGVEVGVDENYIVRRVRMRIGGRTGFRH